RVGLGLREQRARDAFGNRFEQVVLTVLDDLTHDRVATHVVECVRQLVAAAGPGKIRFQLDVDVDKRSQRTLSRDIPVMPEALHSLEQYSIRAHPTTCTARTRTRPATPLSLRTTRVVP